MKLHCQHIAANCAPMPNSLEFLNSQTIAFCFSNQIGLYSLFDNQITQNINSRQFDADRINCVNCFSVEEQDFIVGGYDSGHLVVYEKKEGEWILKQMVKQSNSILSIHQKGDYLLTNNNNAEIIFYRVSSKKEEILREEDKIVFPLNKIIKTILTFVIQDQIVLFLGGVDKQIHCYSRPSQQQKLSFNYHFCLSGHENAITKLSGVQDGHDHLIASSSQDGYIRIWRITPNPQLAKFHKNVKDLFNKRMVFLDSVLISHECSVTCVTWAQFNGLQLVSCSLDCTICIWGRDQQGAWSVDSRVGQFLGNKNAYFNLVVDEQNRFLVAVNYIGSAMIWQYDKNTKKYSLRPSFNGHSNEVKDIDWNHSGDFLVSVSKDQTTRVIASNDHHYHEISRAQIHGYDINAVSTLKLKDGLIDLIVCGADEKVLRIVEPPASFANYLNTFTKTNLHLYFPSEEEQNKYVVEKGGQNKPLLYESYSEGGIQVLGLMTKMQKVEREKITSYYEDEDDEDNLEEEQKQNLKEEKIDFSVPPHDDYLIKHTLWPEMNKLYGHPHQISCLAKSFDGKKIASACNGLSKAASTILVWDTSNWHFKAIPHHAYTVYDMQFSVDSKYLASVSKDRKLAVFDENSELVFSYEAHTRAITSISISPDCDIIATGSRDKIIKLHSISEKKIVAEYVVKKSVHAVAFCGADLLAYGCDDGTVILLEINNEKNLQQIDKVDDKVGATKTISCLEYKKGKLGVGSYDNSVRIFRIDKN